MTFLHYFVTFCHQYQHHIPCGSSIYMKCTDWRYFELPQVNIGDDAAEKVLDQVLAAATICRQHLANKIPMKRLTQEQLGECNNTTNCLICTKSGQQMKKSPTTIIWWVNIEIQPTMHVTWITALIQKKWKFYASFTISKVLFLCYSYLDNWQFLKLILITVFMFLIW